MEPAETDLLVIDRTNSAEYLSTLLARHGEMAKMILIRGSQTFGERAEGSDEPGLWQAMREWLTNHPQWYVAVHRPNQYGLTLLACDPQLKPDPPIVPWPLGFGPGTELKALLASVGIEATSACSCNAFMLQMDAWGITGCQEHFDEIVQRLREKASDWGWTSIFADKAKETPENHQLTFAEKIKIGMKSLTTGIAFRVNWLDPYPGLATEAIARAEKKLQAEASRCGGECDTAIVRTDCVSGRHREAPHFILHLDTQSPVAILSGAGVQSRSYERTVR